MQYIPDGRTILFEISVLAKTKIVPLVLLFHMYYYYYVVEQYAQCSNPFLLYWCWCIQIQFENFIVLHNIYVCISGCACFIFMFITCTWAMIHLSIRRIFNSGDWWLVTSENILCNWTDTFVCICIVIVTIVFSEKQNSLSVMKYNKINQNVKNDPIRSHCFDPHGIVWLCVWWI